VNVLGGMLALAIAGSVLVPRFTSVSPNAKVSAAKSDLATYTAALNQYLANAGQLPTAAQGLQVLTVPNQTVGTYIPSLRNDPWARGYRYRPTPGSNRPFEIRSAGPDGVFSTGDDIVSW
jgi:general secretion pathway protein G